MLMSVFACLSPPLQHISSRRHKDRAAGKPAKPKFSPYNPSQRHQGLHSVSTPPRFTVLDCLEALRSSSGVVCLECLNPDFGSHYKLIFDEIVWESLCFYWPKDAHTCALTSSWRACLCFRFVWPSRRPRTWLNLWPRASYSISSLWLPRPPWRRCPPSPGSAPPRTQTLPCFKVTPTPRRSCTQLLDSFVRHTRRFSSRPTDPVEVPFGSELQLKADLRLEQHQI